MSGASCIYEGAIRHRRYEVSPSEFRHRLALAYVDLEELPRLLDGQLIRRPPGLVRFRRQDYLGDPRIPLNQAVCDEVQRQRGIRPTGPIRLLTHLRSLGHCFNPVSFYYCFDRDGEHLEHVLAEVTNTPWGERRAYVLSDRQRAGQSIAGEFDKQLHVSPFMGMEQSYSWLVTPPGRALEVHIENREGDQLAFDATLSLRRRELTRASLARFSARYPAATVRVLALIYGHALALKLRGVPVHPHPRTEAAR